MYRRIESYLIRDSFITLSVQYVANRQVVINQFIDCLISVGVCLRLCTELLVALETQFQLNCINGTLRNYDNEL